MSFLASGVTQSISVTLTVTNNPVLVSSPTSLWFAYQTGQQLPAPQTIKLTSSNGAPLNYSATSNASWLILTSQTSGTTDNSLTVSANTNGLAANTYTGQIAITGTNQQTGATLTPVNITVTLYVSTNALLLVTPSQPVVFTAPVNSGQPSQLQTYYTRQHQHRCTKPILGSAVSDRGWHLPGSWLPHPARSGLQRFRQPALRPGLTRAALP